MKHLSKYLAALIVLAFVAMVAIAADIYDRTPMTALSSTGTGTWTNDVLFGSIELKRISFTGMNNATDVVTVVRTTAATAADTRVLTNTVIAVTCASAVGSSNLVFAAGSGPFYMKYNDKLTFTTGSGTNGYYYIEYLKQPR
jgi:hypothetical protein